MAEDYEFCFTTGLSEREDKRFNTLLKRQLQVDAAIMYALRHSFSRLPLGMVLEHNATADGLRKLFRPSEEEPWEEEESPDEDADMEEDRELNEPIEVFFDEIPIERRTPRDEVIIDDPEKLVETMRCCANNLPGSTCDDCPYSARLGNCCQDSMVLDAARIIERLSGKQ